MALQNGCERCEECGSRGEDSRSARKLFCRLLPEASHRTRERYYGTSVMAIAARLLPYRQVLQPLVHLTLRARGAHRTSNCAGT